MRSQHKQSMLKSPTKVLGIPTLVVCLCWALTSRCQHLSHSNGQHADLIKQTIQPMAERTPGLGHLFGAAHKLAGDTQRARQVSLESSRDIAVELAHKAGGSKAVTLTNLGIDSYVTLANSIEAGHFRPYGMPKFIYQVVTGTLTLEDYLKHMAQMTKRRIKGKKREKLSESKEMIKEMLKGKREEKM